MAQSNEFVSFSFGDTNRIFYIIVCCDSNEPITVNGKPTAFIYDGTYNNNLDPEKIVTKKMTSFKTIDEVSIEGCYRLEEIECADDYELLNYSEFLLEAEFDTNKPKSKPAIITSTGRTVYAEPALPNDVDPKRAVSVMCDFATAMYQNMLSERMGVKFCCPQDMFTAKLNFNILKLDLIDSSKTHCPTC
ncbi:MAG: hypothetical protein RIR01_2385 [Bacteroidota bacterium]|jgi:hypothetical protein